MKILRRDIAKQYPGLNDEALSQLIPPKADVTLQKLGAKLYVFYCASRPLFIEVDGVEAMVPTVYALWQCGESFGVPMLMTHSLVSPKLLQGADLMLPG